MSLHAQAIDPSGFRPKRRSRSASSLRPCLISRSAIRRAASSSPVQARTRNSSRSPREASSPASLEHPGFGGDSILPRCSGLGGRCLPRYRRLAEPRSDHFSAFVLSNICPAALSSCPPDMAGLRPARHRRGWGISSSGTPACAAGSPGWARVTRSVIACGAGGALDLGGGSVAPVPRPARRCPPAAAPVATCRAISEEGRGPGRSPAGAGGARLGNERRPWPPPSPCRRGLLPGPRAGTWPSVPSRQACSYRPAVGRRCAASPAGCRTSWPIRWWRPRPGRGFPMVPGGR